jgi:hypothetical protein
MIAAMVRKPPAAVSKPRERVACALAECLPLTPDTNVPTSSDTHPIRGRALSFPAAVPGRRPITGQPAGQTRWNG